MTLCQLFQLFTGYLAERHLKQSFERKFKNEQKFNNMKSIVNNLNEMIVAYRPALVGIEILFMNDFFKRLINLAHG